MSNDFEWTETAVARLRTLWAAGLSMTEIGDELGIGKNAVAGKAHRLKLPARPNPVMNRGALDVYVNDLEWCARFIDAYNAGMGWSRMSKLFGLAEGSINGIVRRLKLKPRGAPGRAVLADTLPLLPSLAKVKPAPVASTDVMRPVRLGLTPAAARIAPPQPRALTGPIRDCQFPIGEPGTKQFRFCEDPTLPGRPYCGTHHAICYMPVRTPHEVELARRAA